MKKIQAWILAALLFAAVPAGAQKRNAAVKGKAAAAMRNNGNGGRLLFNTLLPATAKVMVIDSVVVGKNDFLRHIPLNEEAGKLSVKRKIGNNGIPLYVTVNRMIVLLISVFDNLSFVVFSVYKHINTLHSSYGVFREKIIF